MRLWSFRTVASSPPSRNFSHLRFKSKRVGGLLLSELRLPGEICHHYNKPLLNLGIQERLGMMRHGRGSFLVFSGFDGTEEELGLESTNFWLFKNNDMDKS